MNEYLLTALVDRVRVKYFPKPVQFYQFHSKSMEKLVVPLKLGLPIKFSNLARFLQICA